MICRTCGKKLRLTKGPHRWPESGLSNVYVEGGGFKVWKCQSGHKQIQVRNMRGLLFELADTVASKSGTLEADEIRFLRKSLFWKSKEMADVLGIRPESYSRIESGHVSVTPQIDRMVRMIFRNPEEAMNLSQPTPIQEEFNITWEETP